MVLGFRVGALDEGRIRDLGITPFPNQSKEYLPSGLAGFSLNPIPQALNPKP